MITFVYIGCIVAVLIGLVLVWCNKILGGIFCMLVAIITSIATSIYEDQVKESANVKEHPTALDVYRGKTTLEITYRDSVAVDSTVVYKMK